MGTDFGRPPRDRPNRGVHADPKPPRELTKTDVRRASTATAVAEPPRPPDRTPLPPPIVGRECSYVDPAGAPCSFARATDPDSGGPIEGNDRCGLHQRDAATPVAEDPPDLFLTLTQRRLVLEQSGTFADAIALHDELMTLTREQERDDRGRFGSGDGATSHISSDVLAKIAAAPVPTAEDKAAHEAMVARQGATRAGGDGRGSSKDRSARTDKLLKEFGDGEHCPCSYCHTTLDHATLTQDRIYPGSQGGRYIYANLLPACGSCNSSRGDKALV